MTILRAASERDEPGSRLAPPRCISDVLQEAVMKETAKYVASVREPASRFESNWYFGDYEKKLNVTLTDFIENSNHTKQQKNIMNNIASYFGIKDPSDRTTEKEMLVKAKWLNEIFDLVMIAERYDESLVLLKHLMCWDTEDIAYVKAKIRTPESRPEVSEAQKDKLRQLNRQDVFLYKFFREIFEKKVEAFGREKMQKEIEEPPRMPIH
ncbi:galactosylceramide sulfotransferase-like [Penaeus japonicus]|uniref:galactosylceramide sulfotransferase-like n=1 Tax=Penaeus japonicus TaxID=27405 RepID=UPI001C7104FB|nr:galactosylceramide sulfotransferase-like [Penaeus japonicus]